MSEGKRFEISSATLHIIAMTTMLIDHTMKTVVEYDGWIFILGRLAFPIFAFMAAEGCYYTKNAKNTVCVCWYLHYFRRFRMIL
jgi:hypothetical protein